VVRGGSREIGGIQQVKSILIRKKPVVSESLLDVENIGVEPMTSCRTCKRSSQLS